MTTARSGCGMSLIPGIPYPFGPFLTSSSSVVGMAFGRDGRTLAVGGLNGTVQLWGVAEPAHSTDPSSVALTGSTAFVDSVAFSRDGRTLAAGDVNGAVRLWDVTDPGHPRPLGQPLTVSTVAVDSVAFSPGGGTLASGSDGGITQIWNLNVGYAIERICATTGGLTAQQWNEYIPQLRYQTACTHQGL